jgi:hypothetical protein
MIGTLAEGNKYSQTELVKPVIDRLVKDSEVLRLLPFMELLGNSETYNTITTRSGAQFYNVGDTWVESTPVMTQATVTLTVLGGDADVDNFLSTTRSNKIDLVATVLEDKTVAVQETFLDNFYYGTGTAPAFSGLQVLVANTTYNTVHAGSSTGTALSIAKLREAIDLLTKRWRGEPHVMLVSKLMRRRLATYMDSIGEKFPSLMTSWGSYPESFDGIPIVADDLILNTETAASGAYTAKTGSTCTTIFMPAFHELAVLGRQATSGLIVEPLGTLETKDAKRWRIKWYVGLQFKDLRSCAKLDGIASGSAVTA